MNLSRFSIKHPITTAMIYLGLAFLGFIAMVRLPIDLLPDISFPTISVTTNYSGAGPQEVESRITRLLENTLSTVPGVTEISSNSIEGRSSITLRFPWGTDLNTAANDVRPAIDRVRNNLPTDADSPRVAKFDPNTFPIMNLGIEMRGDPTALRDLAENEFRPRIEQVEGVANVDVRGARDRQVHVSLDRQRLEAYGVSDRDVRRALEAEAVTEPGGDVRVGAQRRGVRTTGQFSSLDEIGRSVVAMRGGVPVRVMDVARVEDALSDTSSIVRLNGRPAILIAVTRQSGTNTVAVARRIRAIVERLNEQFPQARMTVISDGSMFIRRSIENVRSAAALGSVLTVAVLLFFLRNISSTLIISTAIPASIMTTILVMFWSGSTLNLMTFGGLALAVGMLVDSAIVVLENIFRHREEGQAAKPAAEYATNEVGTALMASTLTTVVVFLPMFFTTGIASVMFKPLAFVVTVALMCSLIVAMTLIPSLSSRALVIRHGTGAMARIGDRVGGALDRLDNGFRRLLDVCMRHPWWVVLPSVALIVVAWSALQLVPRETFPTSDEREFFISVQNPRGTALEVTDRIARRIEQTLIEDTPGTGTVLTLVGSTFGATATHVNTFRVSLTKDAPPTQEVIADLRRRLRVPGATMIFRPLSSLFIFRSPDPIAIDLRGFDLEVGNATARRLRGVLESVPGVTDVQVSREESAEEFTVRVDPIRAAAFGVTADQVGASVRTYVGGRRAALFRSRGEEIAVMVRLREADRATVDRLQDLPISTPRGVVPLRQFATVVSAPGPTQIQRRNRERVITMTANVTGRDVTSALTEVRRTVNEQRLPRGFSVAFSGEFQDQQESFGQLFSGLMMSIVLVYMVMASQFERLFEPLLIMAAVPFALVGVVATLLITGTSLNVQSGLGAIVLVGVAVNNAIVMITYSLQLQAEGVPLREALARAGQRRLRPILMTTLTTMCGLLPLAIGFGEGAELQAPLARAITGGLVTSTLGSLLLIPAMYMIFAGAADWVRGRRTRPAAEAPATPRATPQADSLPQIAGGAAAPSPADGAK